MKKSEKKKGKYQKWMTVLTIILLLSMFLSLAAAFATVPHF